MVAVSPAFGTGDADRLIGDGARSFGEGSWLTTALVPMTMKDLPELEGRKSSDGHEKGATEPRGKVTPPSALQRIHPEAYVVSGQTGPSAS